MFTGIIQHVGAVRRVETTSAGRRLVIDLGPLADGLREGDSVAVNGACLTATSIQGALAGFDAIPETLRRTTLGGLTPGSAVNLERSLRLGDRLDGHWVQGHVDGQARLERVDHAAGEHLAHFTCERELGEQLVAKGSVAVDGVSLTVVSAGGGRLCVALIPTTLGRTTLGRLRPGDRVNIETDILGKYVRRFLAGAPAATGGGLTVEKLREAGF